MVWLIQLLSFKRLTEFMDDFDSVWADDSLDTLDW